MMKQMMSFILDRGINFTVCHTQDILQFFSFLKYSDHKFFSLSHNSTTSISGGSHQRRHSVGTFASKDKICSTSFIDEPPQEQAPQAPSTSTAHHRRANQRGEHTQKFIFHDLKY